MAESWRERLERWWTGSPEPERRGEPVSAENEREWRDWVRTNFPDRSRAERKALVREVIALEAAERYSRERDSVPPRPEPEQLPEGGYGYRSRDTGHPYPGMTERQIARMHADQEREQAAANEAAWERTQLEQAQREPTPTELDRFRAFQRQWNTDRHAERQSRAQRRRERGRDRDDEYSR